MLFDLQKATPDDIGTFDVCIIGAGAAGLALTAELSKQKLRILLLEGGGLRYEAQSQGLYSAEISALPYDGAKNGRARMLGGTTTQWGGQIVEPDDFVFRARPWVSGSGWPFEKKVLAPYYLRAERVERIENAYSDIDTILRALDLEPIDFSGQMNCDFSRFCPSTDFAAIYSDMIRNDHNVSAFLHANACELVLTDGSPTVRGVRCRTLNGRAIEFSARTFVLCMGGIENSRFLLQPLPDGTTPPWNRYGLVGRFFQDHISCFVADIDNLRISSPDKYFDYTAIQGFKYHLKLKLPLPLQERYKTLDVCGTIARRRNGRDDLVHAYETIRLLRMRRFEELSASRLAHLVANAPRLLWHKLPYGRSALNMFPANGKLTLCAHCEQSPLSDSSISLSPARDALGLFRARVKWCISDMELHSIQTFARIASRTLQSCDLGNVSVYPEIIGDDAKAVSDFREAYHHIGGTRMATIETQGVVDPNLRLFGTSNAFVCGSSVFPCAGFANPTHTIVALAIRLADHLKNVMPELKYETNAVPINA